MDTQNIKVKSHARYGSIATGDASNCRAQPTCCCFAAAVVREETWRTRYSATDQAVIPDAADLAPGHDDLQAIAALWLAETAMDLGSETDLNCFPAPVSNPKAGNRS